MGIELTDQEIARLTQEKKVLPDNFRQLLRVKSKRSSSESDLDVVGKDANEFRLILRQSKLNSFCFSVIFALKPKNSNQLFRLRRYNGKHGEHTNIIEGTKISGFHIHYATERYQRLGTREDAYAEATDRYSNLVTVHDYTVISTRSPRPAGWRGEISAAMMGTMSLDH